MLLFIFGRGGSGKTDFVIRDMVNRARGGQVNMTLIVPEQFSHATERALCETGGNTITRHAEVISFRRLCAAVGAVSGGIAKRCLDEGDRTLLLYSALRSAKASLKVFGSSAAQPEFVSKLLSAIDEFKSCRVSPEALSKAANEAPLTLRNKLNDLAVVYAAYQGAFSDGEIDACDQLEQLFQNLEKTAYFAGKTVYLDGFSGFTAQEFKIIEQIMRQAENLVITLCSDKNSAGENGIFDKAKDTENTLRRIAERWGLTVSERIITENLRAKSPALKILEKSIFSHNAQVYEGEVRDIKMRRAADPFEECELAAGHILSLVRERGYRFRDICVTARNIDEYAGHLETVCDRYGVPVYINRKSPILDKPVIALILGALTVIHDGFRYESMLRYLKTGLTGVRRRSLDLLENYLYTWTVRGSLWTREQGFTQNPDGGTGMLSEQGARTLSHLNRIRDKVRLPLIHLKEALSADPTGDAAATALYDFMSEIALPRRLEAHSRLMRRRGRLQQAAEYRALWEILCRAIDSVGRMFSDTALNLDEWLRLLRLLLSQYEIGTIPVSLDRVNVSSMERIGEGRVRALIILGATDGAMPQSGGSGGLLTDSERDSLSILGVELNPGATARLNEEFRLIYRAIATPEEELFITCPARDEQGAEVRKSIVISRLELLFPSLLFKTGRVADARMQAALPAFDVVALGGEDDLTLAAAKYFEDDPRYSALLKLAKRNAKIPRGPIAEIDNIRAVFGKDITLSASRADKFSSCRYAYFMQYGLRARERRASGLDALEIGTFIHSVLERTLRAVKASGGFPNITRETALKLAKKSVLDFIADTLDNFRDRSPRFKYLFSRLNRIVSTVIGNLYDELSSSRFEPLDFELKFSDKDGGLPALRLTGGGFDVALEGTVDRVDGYEKDGALYVRVIDYKTGSRDFSLDEVLNGIGMQMFLYLFALEELGQARYNKKIIPAGVLYVPVSDGMLEGGAEESEDALKSRREKKLLRKGVLLADLEILRAMDENMRYLPVSFNKDGSFAKRSGVLEADAFYKVRDHIRGILGEIGTELSNGVIDANPYRKSLTATACDFCAYAGACHFEDGCGSDRMRPLIVTRFADFSKDEEAHKA